jgi:hypothetical protein
MKKNALNPLLSLVIALFCLTVVSCGNSIKNAQDFMPNKPPLIENGSLKITLIDGSPVPEYTKTHVANGMNFKVWVKAQDPENKPLAYKFSCDYARFGENAQETDGSQSAIFITDGVSAVAGDIKVHAAVTDEKKAVTQQSVSLGTGKTGPQLTLNLAANNNAYINNSGNRQLEFFCDSNGFYQIAYIADGDPLPSSNNSDPFYRYVTSTDLANPAISNIKVGGNSVILPVNVRLPSTDKKYSVYIIFSDSLNPDEKIKMDMTVDNLPPTVPTITPGGEDNGVRSNVDAVFNEPVTGNSSDFDIRDSSNNAVTSLFNDPISSGNSIIFSPKADLDNYETYTVKVKSGAKFTDRAGNDLILSADQTQTFSTVAIGSLANVAFRNMDDSAIIDGAVYPYAATQTLQAVYTGSESGVSVIVASLVGSMPSEPVIDYTKPSLQSITFTKNTNIVAKAFKKGYKPKANSVTVKMKTQTPTLNIVEGSNPALTYPANNQIFYTSTGSGTITFNGYVSTPTPTYSYSFCVLNGIDPDPISDPDKSYHLSPTISGNGKRIIIKALANSPNMEDSDIFASSVFRLRELATPPTTSAITVSGYPTTPYPNWVAVASSYSGQYLAAIENSTATSPNGYIWTSEDYGTTWSKCIDAGAHNWTGVAISVNSDSTDGMYIAATENNSTALGKGKIWISTNRGVSFSSIDSIQYNWTGITISSDGLQIAAIETNSSNPTGGTNTGGNVWSGTSSTSTPGLIRNSTLSTRVSTSWNRIAGAGTSSTFKFIVGYDTSAGSNNCVWLSSGTSYSAGSNLSGLAYSGDGNTLAVSRTYSTMLSSRNSSSGLLAVSSSYDYRSVALSYYGNFIFGAVYNGQIHKSYSLNSSTSYPTLAAIPSSPTKNWTSIATTSDGNGVVATASGGDIWTADLEGTVWTNPNQRNWKSIATSTNGTVIAIDAGNRGEQAYPAGGYIYTSQDFGQTWTEQKKCSDNSSLQNKWTGIVLSTDGKSAVAVAMDGFSSTGRIYKGTYNGTVWTWAPITTTNLPKYVEGLCGNTSDPNLQNLCVFDGTSGGSIYYSNTGGTSWTISSSAIITASDQWNRIASSPDGSYFVASASDQSVWFSSDKGITWYRTGSTGALSSITGLAVSNTGKIACSYGMTMGIAQIIPNVGGEVWTQKVISSYANVSSLPIYSISGLAVDSSGNNIVMITSSGTTGYILTSIDGGATVTPQAVTGITNFNCVASTPDGLTIYAGQGNKSKDITVIR